MLKESYNTGNIERAVSYAVGSNKLENHILTKEELDQIIDDIKTGKTDESFLWMVATAVRKKQMEADSKFEDVSYGKNK